MMGEFFCLRIIILSIFNFVYKDLMFFFVLKWVLLFFFFFKLI